MNDQSRDSLARTAAWAVAGAVAGFVAGFVTQALMGGGSRARLRDRVRHLTGHGAGPLAASAAARAALVALEADPLLRDARLRVVGTASGSVELHGWVASRSLRARAERTVRGLAGIEQTVNAILVHGEDDLPPFAEPRGDQIA